MKIVSEANVYVLIKSLDKNICMKCRNNCSNGYYEWSVVDEDLWEVGTVYCPPEVTIKESDTTPPESCPYRLEHLMITGELAK